MEMVAQRELEQAEGGCIPCAVALAAIAYDFVMGMIDEARSRN